jgi:hypothetical protein
MSCKEYKSPLQGIFDMHVTPDDMPFGNGVRLDINMPLDINVARCHQHSYRQNERRKQRK